MTNDYAKRVRLTGFDGWSRSLPSTLGIDQHNIVHPLAVIGTANAMKATDDAASWSTPFSGPRDATDPAQAGPS